MSPARVPSVEDLWPGELRGAVVEGRRLVFLNVEGELFAYEDRCAHLGVALSKGLLAGATLTCGAHGWQYDARTGNGVNPPTARLAPIRVERRGAQVWVELGEVGHG